MSGLLYLEHLQEADLALVAAATGEGGSPTDETARLRANPHRVEALLGRRELFDTQAHFVEEWVGSRQRLPVFDTVLADVAQRFGQARRILNYLTDRYLFPYRGRWFPTA